jgi:hypothetical protein
MDDEEAYSSPIAAEAVGERLGSPPTNAGERAVWPVATSSGSQARVADKTAESVGERAGDAYADATTDEAREWSRKFVGNTGMPGRPQQRRAAAWAGRRPCRGRFLTGRSSH